MTHVACHILDTGYCTVSEHMIIHGGRHSPIECHSLVGLLHHPHHGWGLWDTGYAPRMLDAARGWPFGLYRYATPLHIQVPIIDQLAQFNLHVEDIRWIILSHLHADHVAGLHDFPHARLILSAKAFHDARKRQGLNALRRAIIPALLPDNFTQRGALIERFNAAPITGLGANYDLFGDGSLRLVELGGHACGQLGLLVQTLEREIFFAADAAWLSQSVRENRLPHPLTYAIVDNIADLRASLLRVHLLHRLRPDITIIPTHCPEVFAREVALPAAPLLPTPSSNPAFGGNS